MDTQRLTGPGKGGLREWSGPEVVVLVIVLILIGEPLCIE
jgi:hypothetical protein